MGRRADRRRIARGEAQILELIAEAQQRRWSGDDLAPSELPIVDACRRLYADTILQLPMVMLRNRQPAPTQPPIITHPDPSEPRWLTMQRIVDNLTDAGRVWLVPSAWDAAGWPMALRVYDAGQGAPLFDPITGDLEAVHINGQRLPAGPDGVIWLPYIVPHRGHGGAGPLTACWRSVEYLCALYEMAGSFWEAGFPSLALMVKQRLSPDDTDKLKEQLVTKWRRRHEPAVLDLGSELAPIGSSAVESQLVESIAMANAEIARAFGVMPSLVNVSSSDSLTYATTENEFIKWKAIGLGPYLTRVEGAFTQLTPHGQIARFDTAELTRADFATRVAAYATALGGAPWIEVDEVREREGFTPLAPPRALPAPTMGAGDPDLIGALA